MINVKLKGGAALQNFLFTFGWPMIWDVIITHNNFQFCTLQMWANLNHTWNNRRYWHISSTYVRKWFFDIEIRINSLLWNGTLKSHQYLSSNCLLLSFKVRSVWQWLFNGRDEYVTHHPWSYWTDHIDLLQIIKQLIDGFIL